MSKEIQIILDKLDSLPSGEQAVLATVIDVEGSGYRLPGAKMLITENGDAFGTVSGGCLESDVLESARRIIRAGDAEILIYDTTAASEDSIFSLNMGCNGIVRILIEPVEKDKNLFKAWRAAICDRRRQLVATLISSPNGVPVGGRLYYREDGRFTFEGLPEEIGRSKRLLDRCAGFFNSGESAGTYELENDSFFLETVEPPLNLLIFGAGYDAIPLASIANDLGWRVTIVDHRPAFAAAERFPRADEIVVARPEEYPEKVKPDEASAAVVMNHNYEKDREAVRYLVGLNLNYLGALGPKFRTDKLLGELAADGVEGAGKDSFYAPIGLDIGGDTPETIALAIAAEIKGVLSKRTGGFLRDRQGPIYGEKRGSRF